MEFDVGFQDEPGQRLVEQTARGSACNGGKGEEDRIRPDLLPAERLLCNAKSARCQNRRRQPAGCQTEDDRSSCGKRGKTDSQQTQRIVGNGFQTGIVRWYCMFSYT